MTNAAAVLAINAAVALLFAAAFAIIAASYRRDVAAKGFALSYLIGALAPMSDLLIVATGQAIPWSIISYGSLLGGLLLMGASLMRFYGRAPSWPLFFVLFLAGMILRFLIWGGARDRLLHEIAIQVPFAIAMFLCGGVCWRLSRQSSLSYWLAIVFVVTGVHFLAKPMAAAMLGSVRIAQAHGYSPYSLVSQVLSSICLTATGLMAILVVFQAAVTRAERQAETDALTHIPNRRGFMRRAKAAFERARQIQAPISVVMLDLDHFKAVNDRYGHEMGDAVLIAFAHLIARSVPPGALIGRMGGEEFAIVLEGNAPAAMAVAETIRLGAHSLSIDGAASFTTSAGVVGQRADESLKDMLRAADIALYHAKAAGRNCVSNFRREVSSTLQDSAGGILNCAAAYDGPRCDPASIDTGAETRE